MPLYPPAAAATNLVAPTGATYETYPRQTSASSVIATLASGTLYLVAVGLPAGFAVGHICFVNSGTASTSTTHWWFGLFDSSRNMLARTADQTTTVWSASTAQNLAITTVAAGAASSYTTTYSGVHYLGIMMGGTGTNIGPVGGVLRSEINNQAPTLYGSSSTGQGAPPAFPFQASAITGIANVPYAWVGV